MRLAPAAPFPTDRVGLAVSHKTAPSFEYGTLPAAAHCLVKFVTGKRGRSSTEDGCGHHRAFRGGGVLAAVLAGAAASLAITLVLLSFGAGMGFAVVSPSGNAGVFATTFKISSGALHRDGHAVVRDRRVPLAFSSGASIVLPAALRLTSAFSAVSCLSLNFCGSNSEAFVSRKWTR